MKIGFHNPNVSFRGGFNSMVEYAEFSQSLLGHEALFFLPRARAQAAPLVIAQLEGRFPIHYFGQGRELDRMISAQKVDFVYTIKPGYYDGLVIRSARHGIHAMFYTDEFHGDSMAYVSRWMSRAATGREDYFVPHYVRKMESEEDLRDELGIPAEARVFGRHGGLESFNISFVREAVLSHAWRHPRDHFVFLNTLPMNPRGDTLPNIHHLPGTADPLQKARFLATCDAMLHSEINGETFGLAIGEFSVLGKPVITYAQPRVKAHLEMLRGHGLLFANRRELAKILQGFVPHRISGTEYEAYTDPRLVMSYFEEVFLRTPGGTPKHQILGS